MDAFQWFGLTIIVFACIGIAIGHVRLRRMEQEKTDKGEN
jgi:hypothetical protein